MPTETQHPEERVAALQSDLNTKDNQIDALTFSDNDRELSRRDWLEAAQAAEKRVEELQAELDKRPSQIAMSLQAKIKGLQAKLAEQDALLRDVLDGKHTTPGWNQRMKAALSASAEPAAPRDTPAPFAFVYAHPQTAERHTVTVTRDEVARHMEEELFQKLCECFCECQPVGETNVVDCCCDEVAEQFKLAEPDAPIAQYPNRLCHIDYTSHPYRCGCLKGDEEAQRIYDEHRAPVERDERAEFESVCKQLGYLTTRHHALSDQYKEITMQCMWQTWMARAALDKATEGASHE
ncbi:hypothetical protein NJH78_05430 [Pseudomonas chlororaphis]|uniref:hypothetical protein n=1 Tax=Pseudomonas chlororaphis TaxID=587753 RepID=UPI00209AD59E|nr:hypothetical protein [Pseudomonas chlororaphis]MCO7569408.1 hypothetical protein [Pseudomonas chlororaphis]MCO7586747.1 hypothetical protein [Pseudomonas chlororaphis]